MIHKDTHVFAVGDRTVYLCISGAKVDLIQKYIKDYDARLMSWGKLSVNPYILKAANNLIQKNLKSL